MSETRGTLVWMCGFLSLGEKTDVQFSPQLCSSVSSFSNSLVLLVIETCQATGGAVACQP
jgi:hypothetical protein